MTTLYKDIYDTIGSFSNIYNLNDYIEEKTNKLKYICDSCGITFTDISNKNIMIYEMVYYNNNTIYKFKDYYAKVSLLEYMNLSNIKVKKSKYKEVLKIYCNECCKKHNSNSNKLYYYILDEPLHISKSHIKFIKLSENMFIKDYISKKLLLINRYKYEIDDKNNELIINSLSINNKQSIKMIKENDKFKEVREMLKKEFNVDVYDKEFEKLYIKI